MEKYISDQNELNNQTNDTTSGSKARSSRYMTLSR